jgi:transposase
MIQEANRLGGFAMGHPIAVRGDFTSGQLRALATRCRNADQARRLLSIAAVVDGASRAAAARIGGMDRQTLRDWVHRFNEGGPEGLINHRAPGAAAKLSAAQKAQLAALVEQGPIPAVHDVVRWRACDLVQWIQEEFGISVSDDTVYRMLKSLGFSHVSARPKAYKQNEETLTAFKKLCRPGGANPRRHRPHHPHRSLVPGRDEGGTEEQAHLSVGAQG